MQIALCNEVVRDLPIEHQAAFAAAVGYDGLEIAPFTLNADDPTRLSAVEIGAVRQSVEDHGLVVSGLHWLLVAPEGLSITTDDQSIYEKTLSVGLALVDLCAALGGVYVIHGSPEQRSLTSGDEDASRDRALAYFAKVADRAEEVGIFYCLEPLSPNQTNFVTNVDEAVAIVKAIDRPSFRTMVDCCAAGQSERVGISQLLEQHIPDGMIRHVHFNDPNLRGPGEGDLPFAPIVKTLLDLNYDGWIGVEPFVYEPSGEACAARSIGYVRALEEADS